MAITFTPQERKDITRRQLNITVENAGYAATTNTLNEEKAKLLSVDNANKVFYDLYRNQSDNYENEARAMNGVQPAFYTDGTIEPYVAGDLSTSAKFPGSAAALFYPSTPPYVNFVPKVVTAVNGINNSVGTDAAYELNILSNPAIYGGLEELINILANGITGGVSATTSSATDLPAGPVTGLVLATGLTASFTIGDLIFINSGAVSGIYIITAKTQTLPSSGTLTINSILPTLVGTTGTLSIDNTVVGFNATERQTLVSVTYQELLTNLTNRINTLITDWEAKIDTQISALAAQTDERLTQTTQNAAASMSVFITKSTIDAWQLLSPTGIAGRYTSIGLVTINSEINARQAFIPTRITQIITSLGSVAQAGEVITGVVGSPYFERYKWINIRLNRASGSARRYYAADDGIGFLQMLAANNIAVQNEYDTYFLTKKITALDETDIIQVKDVVGLATGDMMTVLSETQPELTRAVIEIMGTTQLRLDKAVPNTYLVDDIARIFKEL